MSRLVKFCGVILLSSFWGMFAMSSNRFWPGASAGEKLGMIIGFSTGPALAGLIVAGVVFIPYSPSKSLILLS